MSVQGEKLKAIADAIRAKKGSSEPIKASDFASEILSIQAGIEPSGTIDISENGVYNVAEYAEANVNVSGGGGGKLAEFMSGALTEITAEDMEGATVIKKQALYYDEIIEKFHTGNTATTINAYAIQNNTALKEITIGENVNYINNRAFLNNYVCEKVVYNGVIPINAYPNTTSMSIFNYLGMDAPKCVFEINSAIVPDYFTIFNSPNSTTGGRYTYFTDVIINGKDGSCDLGWYAFRYMGYLKNVYINCDIIDSENINRLPVFNECGSVESPFNVYIASNVKTLGKKIFSDSKYINAIDFGNIEYIGYYEFASSGIYSGVIELPATLTYLDGYAFYNCAQLTKVIFRGQAPSILVNAFYGCPVTLYDFRNCTTVPTLAHKNYLGYGAGCQIVIPDALYDEWTTATNWSALPTDTTASKYVVWVRASEYVEV